MQGTISKLPPIHIEIHQPGDKGDFIISVYDGTNRAKISENRLPEDHSYLEYIYTARLLEGGGAAFKSEDDAQFAQQVKYRREDLVRYGQSLYQDLFGKGDRLRKYLGKQARFSQGAQLVLRLHTTASELWNIPWEYMHNGEGFVGVQPQFPIVRSLLNVPLERQGLNLQDVPSPLRILMVIAHPKDAAPLNVDTEIAMIRRAVKRAEKAGQMQIDVVEEGTLENLQQALAAEEYHILHYSGHGSIAPQGSFLVMENELGFSRPVFLSQIMPLIQQSASLRFVFLSACRAGTITATKATSGIATGLLQVVPAVLAMQFSVQDRSASLMAEAFYGSLGRGQTLEEALQTSRLALHRSNPVLADWGVPALYTHSPNIRLLNVKAAPKTVRPTTSFDMSALPLPEPFVGRHDERRRIRAALTNPQMRLIYIWGMAGIGKSALVRQALERAGLRGEIVDVLVVRCDKLQIAEVVEQITRFIVRHFPESAPLLNRQGLSPDKRLQAAASVIRNKRLVLVLDGIDQLMQTGETRQAEFPHQVLSAYFRAFAGVDWSILTIMTSRLRWGQLAEMPQDQVLEIHVGSLMFHDVVFLLDNLPNLKKAEGQVMSAFYDKVGGHPLTMRYVDGYLARGTEDNPLSDPQLGIRLAQWWHKLFLAQTFQLLRPEEREALKLLSVHGTVFKPQHVQLLANLATLEEAERIMVGWEALSLAYYLDTDESGTPWYIVPAIVQTYITSQLKPEMLRRSHAEVARMMQHSFYLSAVSRYEDIGGPRPNPENTFHTVIEDLHLMLPRMPVPGAQRYLQVAYDWHRHFREAGEDSRANEISIMLLPAVWLLRAHGLGRKLVEDLLQKTPHNHPQHVLARFWEASYLVEAGKPAEALTLLVQVEQDARRLKLGKLVPEVQMRMGEAQRNQGDHVQARHLWRSAFMIYQQAQDPLGMAQALYYSGESALFHGDPVEAVRAFETALDLLSKVERLLLNMRLVAQLYLYRAHLYRRMNNDMAVLQLYQDTLKIGEQLSDGTLIGKGLESVGYVYGLLGQYEIAARYLLQAVDVYEKIEDMASLCVAQSRLAMVYDFTGSTGEGLVLCERAMQIAAQHAPAAMPQIKTLLDKLKRKRRR